MQVGEGAESKRESQADSPRSPEPNMGMDLRTLKSWPELKSDVQPLSHPGVPLSPLSNKYINLLKNHQLIKPHTNVHRSFIYDTAKQETIQMATDKQKDEDKWYNPTV